MVFTFGDFTKRSANRPRQWGVGDEQKHTKEQRKLFKGLGRIGRLHHK